MYRNIYPRSKRVTRKKLWTKTLKKNLKSPHSSYNGQTIDLRTGVLTRICVHSNEILKNDLKDTFFSSSHFLSFCTSTLDWSVPVFRYFVIGQSLGTPLMTKSTVNQSHTQSHPIKFGQSTRNWKRTRGLSSIKTIDSQSDRWLSLLVE